MRTQLATGISDTSKGTQVMKAKVGAAVYCLLLPSTRDYYKGGHKQKCRQQLPTLDVKGAACLFLLQVSAEAQLLIKLGIAKHGRTTHICIDRSSCLFP